MQFLDALQTYFRGERLEALVLILPVGVVLVAFGAFVLTLERSAFGWGAAIPAVLVGVALIGVGAAVGAKASGRIATLTAAYQLAPALAVERELPRMHEVNALFRATFIAFGIATGLGLGLVYLTGIEWVRGLGTVLVLAGGLGLVIDGVASRRAAPYTAALEAVAAGPPGGSSP